MKKFAKMSLVAAVAVAGMTNVQAADLTEAIKGVDVSGMVRYRYNESKTENQSHSEEKKNDYDAELTAKVPVNDMTTVVAKLDVAADLNDATGDAKANVQLEDIYFSFNTGYATINAGKQNIPGPLTDGRQGTGIVALVPAGPVTIAAGYFNNHNVTNAAIPTLQGRNAMEFALLGSLGPVNFEAWYADVADVLDVYALSASANIGPVALSVGHAEKDMDNTTGDANDFVTTKIEAEAGFGMFTVAAGYATNGKAGTADIADGNDAKVNDFGGEIFDISSENDLDMFKVGVSADVTEKISVGVDYIDGEAGQGNNKTDMNEILLSAAYQMSSNFKISTFYAMGEEKENGTKEDTDKGRLELKYSF